MSRLFSALFALLVALAPLYTAFGQGQPVVSANSTAQQVVITNLSSEGAFTITYKDGQKQQVPTNGSLGLSFNPGGKVWSLQDHCPTTESSQWVSAQDETACWFAPAEGGAPKGGGGVPDTGFGPDEEPEGGSLWKWLKDFLS